MKTTCSYCKQIFKAKGTKQIYCSKKCYRSIIKKRIKHQKKIYPAKKCIVCETEFIPVKSIQQLCGVKCRSVFEKQRYEQSKNITDFKIFERDSFRCIYCGKSSIEEGVKLVIDHIYPRNSGGDNSIYNLITSCNNCNLSKQEKLIDTDIIYRIIEKNINKTINIIESYPDLQERLNKRWNIK